MFSSSHTKEYNSYHQNRLAELIDDWQGAVEDVTAHHIHEQQSHQECN
jgi:hypothetical protein